jgi:metal-sulfur cluster biosynthetic enzyme
MIERDKVLDALSGVRDPELDEPVTDLGFVSDLRLEDDTVSVRLRLPTYFCAPNFAYLMVADAREAVLSVPGVRRASVKAPTSGSCATRSAASPLSRARSSSAGLSSQTAALRASSPL